MHYGDLELFLLSLQLDDLLPLFRLHKVQFSDLISMTDKELHTVSGRVCVHVQMCVWMGGWQYQYVLGSSTVFLGEISITVILTQVILVYMYLQTF